MKTGIKTFGLTGNQLKILALLLMTVDHIGMLLFPEQMILRLIGRLAMPIFAWMIAEGCRYTKNRLRYLGTILGVGLICQVVYLLFMHSLEMCILITFSLSAIVIFALDYAQTKKTFLSLCLMGLTFAAVTYICVFLPGDLRGFRVDYGIFGVLLPVLIYMGQNKEQKLMAAAIGLLPLAISHGYWQWFSFLALPLLVLYNGQRGKHKLKYLFYIYYPLHLAAIYGITLLLR